MKQKTKNKRNFSHWKWNWNSANDVKLLFASVKSTKSLPDFEMFNFVRRIVAFIFLFCIFPLFRSAGSTRMRKKVVFLVKYFYSCWIFPIFFFIVFPQLLFRISIGLWTIKTMLSVVCSTLKISKKTNEERTTTNFPSFYAHVHSPVFYSTVFRHANKMWHSKLII